MMNRAAISLLFCATLGLAGCPPVSSSPHGDSPSGRMPGASASANDGSGPLTVALLVSLRMYSIEVPLGAASGSEDIWSYVNEEAVRPPAAGLARNGFRVGVARRESWPHLERIFVRLTGRQARDAALSALPGETMQIVLKPAQPAQTIFTFYADRTVTGRDYPPSDNVLALLCAINTEEPNQVIVVGQPQLRSTQRTTRIIDDRTGFLYVNRPEVYDLGPLTFQLSVPSHDLLVVGPGAAARRATSVARHFLIKQKEGIEFETVLVLVPSVIRVPGRLVPADGSGPSDRY